MKASYDHEPLKLEAVGNGSFCFRWNIQKTTVEGNDIWTCDETIAWKKTKDEITRCAIREIVSPDKEMKLINDFNAANAEILPASSKQPYLDYIAQRDILKADIDNYFS